MGCVDNHLKTQQIFPKILENFKIFSRIWGICRPIPPSGYAPNRRLFFLFASYPQELSYFRLHINGVLLSKTNKKNLQCRFDFWCLLYKEWFRG